MRAKIGNDVAWTATRFLIATATHLPLRMTRALGAQLGLVLSALAQKDRRLATAHIRLAFPDLERVQVKRLLRANAIHMGQTFGEVVWLWTASTEQVLQICTISGVEHVQSAREHGRGVVLFTAHCGNWEILNAMLNLSGIPMSIAVRDLRDPRFSEMATQLRSRFGSEVIARGTSAGRRLAQALAANRVNGLLIDQDIRDIPGVFVPFFGRPAWTPVGGGTLAVRAGCASVAGFVHRRPDGTHHVTIDPLETPSQGDHAERAHELTARATAAIETQIRTHPAQWVWFHRRWRTQPDDHS